MIYRKLLISSFCLLLFFSIGIVIANDDDNVTGELSLLNVANDPPIFTDWFNTSELIEPNVDVDFFAEVFDIDNVSTELTVTFYYSYDNFVSQNYSVAMNYDSVVDYNTYRFELTIVGKSSGTYMSYYYHVFDGENRVKEDDSGFFYDIEWQLPPVVIDHKPKPEPEPEIIPRYIHWVWFFFFGLIPAGLLYIGLAYKKTKPKKV